LDSSKLDKSGGTLTGVIYTNSNIQLTNSAKLKYPSGTTGHVLTSDENGLLTLQAPSGGGGGGDYASISYDSGTSTTTISDNTILTSVKFSGDN
jgi:hypothetical protein